jgi:Protein of unknown function, DUF417
MNAILNTAISPFVLILRRSGLLTEDLDYHLVRASMVIMFFFFGYQKWWPYEAERLVPFMRRWFDTVRERPGTQRAYARGEPYSSRPTVTEEGKKLLFGQTGSRASAA